MNLLIKHHGAMGDHGFTLPAIQALRSSGKYDRIILYHDGQACKQIYENTGLIDGYVMKDKWLEHPAMDFAYRKLWFHDKIEAMGGVQEMVDFNGVVPSVYMFHSVDPKYGFCETWKRKNAEGVIFYDLFSKRAGILDAAKGKRPEVILSQGERDWLYAFRKKHNIIPNTMIIGWQFTGSGQNKWYPFFQEVAKAIMDPNPYCYFVTTGDPGCIELEWPGALGRHINLAGKISYRQAFILTSLYDCFISPETGVFVMAQAFPETPKILLATHSAGYHYCNCFDDIKETEIIQSEARCSPCYNIIYDCRKVEGKVYQYCMGKIPTHKVVGAIERQIKLWKVRNDLAQMGGVLYGYQRHNGSAGNRNGSTDRGNYASYAKTV